MTGSIIAPFGECDRRPRPGASAPDVVVWEGDGEVGPFDGYGDPLARRLEAAGFVVAVVPLPERAPTATELAAPAHVVSGGNTSTDDPVDWLVRSAEQLSGVIDRALAGEAAIIGICFGAQLLARVLFGERAVVPHRDGLHAGLIEVRDRESGTEHVVSSFHHHQIERRSVMRGGGDVVMSSDLTPVQAFEMGSVRGVQFHPEWGPAELTSALWSNRHVTDAYDVSLRDLEASIRERADRWNDRLWNRFVVEPARTAVTVAAARQPLRLAVSPHRLSPWTTAATV
ncbi:type 1 glutamine amidotransferase [Ilumatobacter nonamiensis]|uniref:type 1 glutamine amidotransferase n=1 Tax=Ilumatobacter nonamiensis TaxID=467093 RepID=UPI000348A5DE|nr:hypothetical protein [Ilumatobacter nonamiensis]